MRCKPVLSVGCLLVFTFLFTSGCWSQKNLEYLTVVSGLGLDAAPEGQIEVTVQLLNPTPPTGAGGSGKEKRPFAIYSATAKTINGALDLIQQQTKKTLFLTQTRSIVISEKLARRGVHDHMDYFWRSGNKNLTAPILISKRSAKETLQYAKELENVPSDAWRLYFMNEERRPSAGELQLYLFLPRMDQIGHEAIGAGIIPATGGNIMKISNTAVFHQGKMVGWLSNKETEMMRWIKKEIGRRTVLVDLTSDNSETLSFRLSGLRSRFNANVQGKQITIEIRLKAKAEAVETALNMDFTDLEIVRKFESRLNGLLQDRVQQTLTKIYANYRSDIIGFGEFIHQRHPGQWKKLKPNWRNRLPQLDFKVEVKTTIINSGLERVSKSQAR
ncbi:Ger(x)C family spore germination protein [Paenibacillus sp. IB182493]|uniref:Ger(X)C family spore germination protein n=2 Tax=Paenibacillus arenilitoris TaxID=2772299 RepID=A0A927CLQ3_9BACL|nr:Ger(x)C family spore germination protein [Paenibacillus arenilitoris]